MRFSKLDLINAVACLVFIVVLAIAAWFDPSIRGLHFFQAWLYVAIAVLALKRNKWGYFLGLATGAFWAYLVLFLNGFFQAGREQLVLLVQTGSLPRPDLIIAVPALLANLTIVLCCLWAYLRLPGRRPSDFGLFALSVVISIGYFALDMAVFQPRYLGMFARITHPHLRF
jgi:hypothetical protein